MPSFFPLFAYRAILLLMVVVAVEVVSVAVAHTAIADCSFDDQEETVFLSEEVTFGLQACLADGRWQ